MIIIAQILAAFALTPPAAVPEAGAADPDILVTGRRHPRDPLGVAEAPYPETARTPLGSRIARRGGERPYRQIATETGLAGLTGGATGLNGVGMGDRNRRVTECVAEHRDVREDIACALFDVQAELDLGNAPAAAMLLATLEDRRRLTGAEQYYVGYYVYRLGQAAPDGAARERGLDRMLASGLMSETDRDALARHRARQGAAGD